MKKLFAFILGFCFISNLSAAPLIYKTVLESKGVRTETAVINTAIYRKIRVVVKRESSEESVFKGETLGLEDGTEFVVSSTESTLQFNTVIEVPPTNIKIQIKGAGRFRVFVWAVA